MTDTELLLEMAKNIQEIKHDMHVMKDDIHELKTDVRMLKDDVQALKDDVQVLKDDVQALKDDVQVLKDDVQALKDDVQVLKDDVQVLKEKVQILNGDVQVLKEAMASSNQKLAELSLKLENETNHNIQILAENHLNIIDKLNAAIRVQDKSILYEVQISGLKSRMDCLERDVETIKRQAS